MSLPRRRRVALKSATSACLTRGKMALTPFPLRCTTRRQKRVLRQRRCGTIIKSLQRNCTRLKFTYTKMANTFFLMFSCVFLYQCQAKGLFEDSPQIEHLTQENFEKKVLQSDRAWLVEFYDPKNKASEESVPEIQKLARILAGIAKVGVVDATEHEKLAHSHDAKETPTIILFGADKEKPTLYKDKIKSEQLIKKVGAQVKSMVRAREEKGETNPKKDVVKLTDENFQRKVLDSDGIWFVKYYDPNCGHSKAYAPEYAKAAAALKGAVHVGAVNMDVEIYDKMGAPYDIDKVPLVKIFGVDKVKPADYTGARKATDLVDRALEEMEKLVKLRLSGEKNSEDPYEDGQVSEEDEEEKAARKKKEEEDTTSTKIKKDADKDKKTETDKKQKDKDTKRDEKDKKQKSKDVKKDKDKGKKEKKQNENEKDEL